MVDKNVFRDGMSRLGAAVNVVTTNGAAGLGGFTATAVCSVSDEPPTLLVCMKQSSFLYNRFIANKAVCVNVLNDGQQDIAGLFAGGGSMTIDERFAATPWYTLQSGAPAFRDALVAFDCTLTEVVSSGTHGIFLCQVQDVAIGPISAGLGYFDRSYVAMPARPPA